MTSCLLSQVDYFVTTQSRLRTDSPLMNLFLLVNYLIISTNMPFVLFQDEQLVIMRK